MCHLLSLLNCLGLRSYWSVCVPSQLLFCTSTQVSRVCADTLARGPPLGCSGTKAAAAGMCTVARRLLIGYLVLLFGRLYCCSSQRKSRGERIISQLIPTLLISHHSLPQPLIYRRVNFFSLFSLFWDTKSLFPLLLLLLLFRIAWHYRPLFSRRTGRSLWNSQEKVVALFFPPARENRGRWTNKKEKINSPPRPWCNTLGAKNKQRHRLRTAIVRAAAGSCAKALKM